MVEESELKYLRRAVELAEEALEAGDAPFGSVLVSASGEVLFEDRNRTSGGDQTLHPEFEIARWAAGHVAPEDRATATVYTSGEHCPMCSSAHAWVGLGRIVYAMSGAQFSAWSAELGGPAKPVELLPIQTIAPGIPVDGPVPPLDEAVHKLVARWLS